MLTQHPDGLVDLSVGTPVDPTPDFVRRALADAADSPGYPLTIGRVETRQAALDWMERRLGVTGLGLDAVIPTIGSKELIASLPTHLGVGPGDLVVHPELAYPTYEVGAMLAGARTLAADSLTAIGPEVPRLLWLNSPANPTGRVLPVEHLRKVVDWCRDRGTVLVSDECYIELGWESQPVSVLHPDVCGGSAEGVLAVHSLSKRSNLAGYRCAFVAGDPALVGELLAVRKNLGLQVPGPQQVAMTAALADDTHVEEQRERYAGRRAVLRRRTGGRRVPDRPLRGVAVPLGDPGRGLLGDRRGAGGARDPGRPGRLLRRGGERARAGGPHRDRRAGRRRCGPAVTRAWQSGLSTAGQRAR